MDKKNKKKQIRELAEEASNAGKSKKNNSEKGARPIMSDPNEIKKDLMKELTSDNVKIINNLMISKMIDTNDDEYDIDAVESSPSEDDENNRDTDSIGDNDKDGLKKGILTNLDNIVPKVNINSESEFKENVVKFVKMDDLIRQKMEELKELKDQKKPYEEYILGYLEKKDAPFVNIKTGKLIKNKSETKSPLKLEIIKESIVEGIKGENNIGAINDIKCNDISDKIIELMNSKRGKNSRTNLKRTFLKKKKNINVKNGEKNVKEK